LSSGYLASGSLYYDETSPVGEHTGEDYELSRLAVASGRVLARRRWPNPVQGTLLADGSLWVTSSSGNRTSLWRLDPRSLAVRSVRALPSSRPSEGLAGSLAAAGGWLWVGAGSLDRVSLRTGLVDRIVNPPYPGPVQVVADQSGRTLMASLGYQHPTYIARLNPVTGEVVARVAVTTPSLGQPTFGGIVDGGAWVENSTGTRTAAWRIDVKTLHVTRTSSWAVPSRRIGLQVHDGILWVSEPLERGNLDYCANPVTGKPLVRLPLLRGDSVFLTADASDFYFTDVPINAHSVKLESAPISRSCSA
jgi:hypothetical protein